MNKILFFFLAIFLFNACTLDPCLTKGQFVNGFNTFTEKVSEDHKEFSIKDWEAKDLRMDEFVGSCYEKHEEKLTDDEKQDFWLKYFKYKYYRHGRKFLSAIEADVEEFSLDIEDELEDLFDNPEEDFKRILNELYGDDLEKAIDDFVDGIGDLADKIKEWLDKE